MISLLLAIAFAGFISWIVLQIPMPQPFRNLFLGVMVFCLVVYVLRELGLVHGFGRLK